MQNHIGTDYYRAKGFGASSLSPEARLVLLIAQWVVDGRSQPEIDEILAQKPVDWEHFNTLLSDQELGPFAYTCFKNYTALIPAHEVDLLKTTQYANLARIAGLQKEFLDIADIFRNNGVEVLPLKGISFLIDDLYGDKTGLRPMVDIDILVKIEKFQQAEKLVESLGYHKDLLGLTEEYWKKRTYHIEYSKAKGNQRFPTLMELHWLLDYPGKIRLLPSLWERAGKVQFGERVLDLLSPEDTLFCLALHARRFGNVLSLKSGCDFARMLTVHKDLDWDYILQETQNGRMAAILYFRLMQADILFDIKVPDPILKKLRVGCFKKRLIRSFISKKTFPGPGDSVDSVFLNNHFLVYDNFCVPVGMIINLPQEQFAKFFKMTPYSSRALWLYRLRFLYFPYYVCVLILKAVRKYASGKFIIF